MNWLMEDGYTEPTNAELGITPSRSLTGMVIGLTSLFWIGVAVLVAVFA